MTVRRTPLTPLFDPKKQFGSTPLPAGGSPCNYPVSVPGVVGATWINNVDGLAVVRYQDYPTDGISVVDVSDPDDMAHQGDLTDSGDADIFIGSSETGDVAGYFVLGQYEYISGVTYTARTQLVDVSTDPTSPSVVGTYSVTGVNELHGPTCVFSDSLVGVIYGSGTFRTIDTSTPASPALSGSVSVSSGSPLNCRASTSTEALITSTGGLRIVDVTTPASPSVVSSYVPGFTLYDAVRVDADHIYVSTFSNDSVIVLDVSTIGSPSVVTTLTHPKLDGAYNFLLDGTDLYLVSSFAGFILKIDVSTPASPSVVGSVCVSSSPRSMALFGDTLIVPAYHIVSDFDGLVAIPLSDF